MDAVRLLRGEGSVFEQELLREGRAEAPSAELEALMMGSVPLAPLGAAAPSLSASIAPPAAVAPWKVILASSGLGLSLLVGAGFWINAQDADTQALSAPPRDDGHASSAASGDASSKVERVASGASTEALPADDADVGAAPLDHRSSAAATSGSKSAAAPGTTPGSQLAEELRQLEQARAALRDSHPEQALSILDRYDVRFPSSTLRQEATVLRAKALQARGQTKEAENLKKDFRKMHPQSAHSRQMQGSAGE